MFINHEYPYHVFIQFAQKNKKHGEHCLCVVEFFKQFSRRQLLWEEISYYFSLCLVNIDYEGRAFDGNSNGGGHEEPKKKK